MSRELKLMTGIEYYRLKRHVRLRELKELTGVEYSNLKRWRDPRYLGGINHLTALMQIADYLNVTADQLFEIHAYNELGDGDRPQWSSKYARDDNPISNYRTRNGLSYRTLASRLGCSYQNAMNLCRSGRPNRSTIAALADHEHITPEEFIRRFEGHTAA